MLQLPCDFAQLLPRDKIWDYIPLRMIDWTRNKKTNTRWNVDNTEQVKILIKTSLSDEVTSTLIWTANSVNCDHSWCTSSFFLPTRWTSAWYKTFAMIPKLGSTALVSSKMISSAKGYYPSRTTKKKLTILSRCRSTSAWLRLFPSLSDISHLGVSNIRRWSLWKFCGLESAAKCHGDSE